MAPHGGSTVPGAELSPPLEQVRHFTRTGAAPHGEPASSGHPDGRMQNDMTGIMPVSPSGAPMSPAPGSPPPGFGPAAPGQPGDWTQEDQEEQSKFDSFKPDEPAQPDEQPPPQVRNGRVLLLVLTAAVLILAIPLGTLWLLGKIGDPAPADFNPAIGACVKKNSADEKPVMADCAEADAFKVVSKVTQADQCGVPNPTYILIPGKDGDQVLCLKPANAG